MRSGTDLARRMRASFSGCRRAAGAPPYASVYAQLERAANVPGTGPRDDAALLAATSRCRGDFPNPPIISAVQLTLRSMSAIARGPPAPDHARRVRPRPHDDLAADFGPRPPPDPRTTSLLRRIRLGRSSTPSTIALRQKMTISRSNLPFTLLFSNFYSALTDKAGSNGMSHMPVARAKRGDLAPTHASF